MPRQTGMSSQPSRRPDASMSLLSEIVETSLDPGYARAHRSDEPPPRSRGTLLLTLLLAGGLIGMAVLADTRQAPQAALERKALIGQVKQQQATNEARRKELAELEKQTEELRARQLGKDSSPASRLTKVAAAAGATRVTGPGVVITVDDSTTLTGTDAEVIDQDLRVLVNGLWASDAEAISINGHRVTNHTAIRGAGRAITVDYVSLTRPYVVRAIGNPRTLPGDFTASSGGRWWVYLKQNYGMRYELTTSTSLTLEPDPGLRTTKAGPRK